VQVSVKFVVAASTPVDWLPLVVFVPLQPPDAAQLVALVEDQAIELLPPLATLVGLAVIVTVGAGVGELLATATVAEARALKK
jgi:hypothetical protein